MTRASNGIEGGMQTSNERKIEQMSDEQWAVRVLKARNSTKVPTNAHPTTILHRRRSPVFMQCPLIDAYHDNKRHYTCVMSLFCHFFFVVPSRTKYV